MKNKYTFWLILLAIFSSSFAFSQTNPTNMVGAWQQKDTVGGKVVQFRNSSTSLGVTKVVTPATLSDSLKNYVQIQDGLISGGEATLGVGSVTIDTAVYRINKVQYTSFNTVFSGIVNSPSGTQYYLVVYGEIGGTLDTISGARDTIAVIPSIPANTVKINTILVGDGGVESSAPDLSGFSVLIGNNNFNGNQNINGKIQVSERVGIGTTSPFAKLVVSNSGAQGIELGYSNTLSANYLESVNRLTGVSEDMIYYLTNTASHRFYTGGSELLRINNLGVGIGKTNPVYKLDVDGDINISSGSNYLINGVPLSANPDTTVYRTVANSYSLSSGQAKLNETNFGQFMDLDLATKLTPSSGDFLLGRDIITNEAVEIPFSTVQPNDATLTALATYNTNGILTQTAADTFTGRTITGTTDQVNVINGNGVSGNPTLSLPQSIATTSSPQFSRLGLGLAASANHYLTTAANTSTIGSWLWTPSSTDYTGTVSGTFYNNANELKFYDGTISGTNRLVKLRNNQSLAGLGTVGVIFSNVGDLGTVPITDRLIAGEVQTSANRTLTLTDFGTNGTLTVYCTTTGGDVTITLPSVTDMRYLEVTIIKVTAGNNVIISGSANINGSASITESAQYKSYTLVSNGTQYYIKGERP